MIRMPDFITEAKVKDAIMAVMAKKGLQLAYEIELYFMEEGKSVQMLHTGSFDKEPETLKQIGDYIKSQNLQKNGFHHEIYLSDFRKTASDKLKTILREPVK
jgi:hypothetical protein